LPGTRDRPRPGPRHRQHGVWRARPRRSGRDGRQTRHHRARRVESHHRSIGPPPPPTPWAVIAHQLGHDANAAHRALDEAPRRL